MICFNLDLCFHLWGSQQFEAMPGAEQNVFEYFLEREMTETGLTEDELFEYRENELSHIRDGTVSLIPREDLERVLDLLQECIRLRIELGALVPTSVETDLYVLATPKEMIFSTSLFILMSI